MNALYWVNFVAGFALIAYLYPVSLLVHHWRHRWSLIAVSLVMVIRIADPAASWIPEAEWPTVAMNVALVFAITAWRKELWKMIKEGLNGR